MSIKHTIKLAAQGLAVLNKTHDEGLPDEDYLKLISILDRNLNTLGYGVIDNKAVKEI